jgi:UDP-3-O-[3-hydroxymyristoyl] glucosamine N-acyltransferase
MKIFIHGNGDYSKEIDNLLTNIKYYSKSYYYEIYNHKNKLVENKKIKCIGFSHTETLHEFDINKIKKYNHIICSSQKQDVFEKFIIDNDLKVLKCLLVNSPLLKNKNKIGKGIMAFHTFFGNYLEIGDYSFFGPLCIIGNRAKIGDKCTLFQKITIDRDVVIDNNTVITANVMINKGVKIGKNCYIGPNQIIMENIEDNSVFINGKNIKNIKNSEYNIT